MASRARAHPTTSRQDKLSLPPHKRPIESTAHARAFVQAMREKKDKEEILNDFYDQEVWDQRVKAALQWLNEDEGADAILQLVETLLSEQLLKPCYQSQLQRMLRGLMCVEQAVHRCLHKYPEHTLLFRFLMIVASSVHEDEPAAARLRRFRDRLEDEGREFYFQAINGGIRTQGELDGMDVADMPSMRHDNDQIDFRRIEICPTQNEVLSSALPYLPSLEEGSQVMEDRELAVLDAQFRMLREDFVGILREEFREGIRGNRRTAKKFPGAVIQSIECGRRPLFRVALQVRVQGKGRFKQPLPNPTPVASTQDEQKQELSQQEVKQPDDQSPNARRKHRSNKRAEKAAGMKLQQQEPEKRDQQQDDKENGGKQPHDQISRLPLVRIRGLEVGSLVCLKFAGPPDQLLFGKVESSGFDEQSRGFVDVDFGAQALDDSLHRFRDGTVGELISVCPSYFAYEPVLHVLQTMDVPISLGASLIHGEVQPSSCVFQLQRCPAKLRAQIDGLDQRQRAAFDVALRQSLTLIQGPPGTGKTHIGSLLGQAIYHGSKCRILCVCYTNHALDQFLEALLAAGICDIVRIGGNCKSQLLEPFKLGEIKQAGTGSQLSKSQLKRSKLLRKSLNRLKEEVSEIGATLRKNVGDTNNAKKWSWRLVSNFLKENHPDYYAALSLPATDDGYLLVGQSGGPMKADELWDCWVRGDKLPAGLNMLQTTAAWTMPPDARHSLVEQWRQELFTAYKSVLEDKMHEFREKSDALRALYGMGDARVLSQRRIIGITTTGAAKYKQLLRGLDIEVVLVEEASEVLEAHIFTALAPSTKHMIMIGDHEQLRPKVANYALSEEARQGHQLNVSTFERLIRANYPYEALSQQHRMRPEISAFVRELAYPHLEDHPAATADRPALRGVASPIVFVQHTKPESGEGGDDGGPQRLSRINHYEVQMVEKVVYHLALQGYKPEDMAVITPYLGQLLELRTALQKTWKVVLNELDKGELAQNHVDVADYDGSDTDSTSDDDRAAARISKLRIATVDNFQGEEAKIIIISLVRSNNQGIIGFLSHKQRVNVLLSRARDAMILVGNFLTLTKASGAGGNLWKGVIRNLQSGHYIFNGFPIKCQRHDNTLFAKTPQDFPQTGGCNQICNEVLRCGHHCTRKCHPHDLEHKGFRCEVLVDGTCADGHSWQRPCYDIRRSCTVCRKLNELERQSASAREQHEAARRKISEELEIKQRELQLKHEEVQAALSVEKTRERAEKQIQDAIALFNKAQRRLEDEAAAEERRLQSQLGRIRSQRERLEKEIAARQHAREQQLVQQLAEEAKALEAAQHAQSASDAELAQRLVCETQPCCQCQRACRRIHGLLCRPPSAMQRSNLLADLEQHFVCNQCITHHIDRVLASNVFVSLQQLEAAVACPIHGCRRGPYKLKEIQVHCVDESVRQAYKLREKELREWENWQPPETWVCRGRIDWNAVSPEAYDEYDVPPASAEFHDVLQQFAATMAGRQVERIVRIENPFLWQAYCIQRDKIGRKNKTKRAGSNANEKLLWHGCRDTDPALIKRSNVDFRHGESGYYGRAAYFAVDAAYSDAYAHVPTSAGLGMRLRTMFLCQVAVGKAKDLRAAQHPTLVKPPDGCDSVLGTVAPSRDAYMIYNDSQCYPQYEVWYR